MTQTNYTEFYQPNKYETYDEYNNNYILKLNMGNKKSKYKHSRNELIKKIEELLNHFQANVGKVSQYQIGYNKALKDVLKFITTKDD